MNYGDTITLKKDWKTTAYKLISYKDRVMVISKVNVHADVNSPERFGDPVSIPLSELKLRIPHR